MERDGNLAPAELLERLEGHVTQQKLRASISLERGDVGGAAMAVDLMSCTIDLVLTQLRVLVHGEGREEDEGQRQKSLELSAQGHATWTASDRRNQSGHGDSTPEPVAERDGRLVHTRSSLSPSDRARFTGAS